MNNDNNDLCNIKIIINYKIYLYDKKMEINIII